MSVWLEVGGRCGVVLLERCWREGDMVDRERRVLVMIWMV